MTTFSSRITTRGPAVRDLAAIWIVVTAVLTYLDVPLQHAPLFAINLVLQASLGVAVITYLLKGVAPSLLLLCGPGLILGGALSFAIFQVAGRGVIGVVTTIAVGVAATTHLLVSREPYETFAPRWWLLGQMVGMAMLAIATEFTELLPIAVMLLVVGIILNPNKPRYTRFGFSVTGIAVAIAIGLVFARSDDWWIVTDDYQFLEVLTHHIATEGPTATWGIVSFAQYHWLSYGWAGVLDLFSGGPEALVTLTRVMPVTYSISLAASLALIAHTLMREHSRASIFLGTWSVVAVGKFEWTGTSTGGVFSVLASAVAVGILVSRAKPSAIRSLTVLALFAVITTLTKAPALIGLSLAALTATSGLIGRQLKSQTSAVVVTALGMLVSISLSILMIWTFGELTDDRIQLVLRSGSLGQLSEFGASFSAPALVGKRLFIWFPILYCTVMTLRRRRRYTFGARWAILALGTLATGGLVAEVFVQSRANTFEYISEPMYFLASMSIIQFVSISRDFSPIINILTDKILLVVFLALGALWGFTGSREIFWDGVTSFVSDGPSLKVELLKFAWADSRLLATAAAAAIIGLGVTSMHRRVSRIFLVSLIVLSVGNLVQPALSDYREGLSAARKELIMGTESVRTTGSWLNSFTKDSDLIATNHRAEASRDGEADFALAVWSRREFLSLGRTLSTAEISEARLQAMAASQEFADRPNPGICQVMRTYEVKWYVVNLKLTENRDWSICAEEVFSEQEFVVLALGSDR